MKYIRGIWRLPERFTLNFDEDLIASPMTKTVFEATLTARWRGAIGLDWTSNDFETKTLRLVASSENVEANNLYLLEISEDGEEIEYWSYQIPYETPIQENNSVTLRCGQGCDGDTTIIFGLEPQEVSDEFYNWWTTHAIEVPNMSVDLSKYNLSGDTHTVVIKTLDANGNVIDISNEVVWEKAAQPLSLVVPDCCWLEYTDANGDWITIYPGEPFTQPIPEDARISCYASVNGEGNGDINYNYRPETNDWDCSYSSHPFTATDIQLHSSLGGAPVTTLQDGAFCGWEMAMWIERLYLPTSITYIGEGIFDLTPNFKEIIYAGTMAEWNTIAFHENWNAGGPAFIVTCTDGTINVPKGGSSGYVAP